MSTNSPLSAWHLPSLLIPLHQHKKTSILKNPKQRSHFLPIVAYVYRNRFAIASQIQRRFSHVLKSDRTTRRHLTELESLGYLGLVPTRGTSPLWPKTYFCTAKGARRLRHSLEVRGRPGHVIRVDRVRPKGYSAEHVLHELLITELLLNVWNAALFPLNRSSLSLTVTNSVAWSPTPVRVPPAGQRNDVRVLRARRWDDDC